jgi:hypothetical protein
MLTLPRTVSSSTTLEEGYDKVRIPLSQRFGLIRLALTQPRPGHDVHRRLAGKKDRHGIGLRVISLSRPRRHHGVQGWPAIPRACCYSHLHRDRQNFTSKAPRCPGLLLPYKRAGPGSTRKNGEQSKTQVRNQVPASKGTQFRDQHLKQPPLYSFTFFETWARRPLSPACNPYTST